VICIWSLLAGQALRWVVVCTGRFCRLLGRQG